MKKLHFRTYISKYLCPLPSLQHEHPNNGEILSSTSIRKYSLRHQRVQAKREKQAVEEGERKTEEGGGNGE